MKYDVAISFAGPQRNLARLLASELRRQKLVVFFDEDFEHDLLGRDGSDYLNEVFLKHARLCVALISKDYESRSWAQLERRAAQARELTEGPGFLIPVLVDDVQPEWLLPSRIYFDLRERHITELAILLRRKIDSSVGVEFVPVFELKGFYKDDTRVAVLGETDNFLAWSRDYKLNSSPETKKAYYDKSVDGWRVDDAGFSARGGFLVTNGSSILATPDQAGDILAVYRLDTGETIPINLPRGSDYDSVTDCRICDSIAMVAFCTGDVWAVNIDDCSFWCIRDSYDIISYTYADFGPTGIAVISDENQKIETRAISGGELLHCYKSQGDIAGIRYFATAQKLLVAGHHEMSVYAFPSWDLIRQWESPEYFRSLVTASAVPIFGFVNGMMGGMVDIYHIDQERSLCRIKARFPDRWNSVAIAASGSHLAAAGDGKLVIFEKRRSSTG